VSSQHSPSTNRRRPTVSRRVRAGLATAAVIAVVGPLAAACGAGFDPASEDVKPNAGAGTAGALKVNNVWVVADPSTGNAEVLGAVANTGTGTASVQSVEVNGVGGQFFQAADSASPGAGASGVTSSPVIDPGQSVSFGEPGEPQVELAGSALHPGDLAQVVFSFGGAGSVTITAQVEANAGLWADYDPNAAVASPSPSASPSPRGSSSAGVGAGSSASASASASPSASSS
jgi:hypothetical protein